MRLQRFVFRSPMPASAEEVFEWHCRSGALERLLPPWEPLEVLERDGGVTDGGRVVLAVRAFGWWHRWVAEHYDYQPGRQFCDRQTEGPFRHWRHCHRVFPEGPNQSYLEEELEYTLPLGRVGQLLGGPLVRRKLERMFRYRHAITASDLALHREYAEGRRMRIAVTGSSGLVGSALVPFLTTGGHQVTRIVRSAEAGGAVFWDPVRGELDAEGLEGHDAVIHLAGENIAARRWSPEQKDRIRDSRVKGTRLLCETLARLRRPPRVVVSASAIGYYGDRGDDVLDEGSPRGTGFLPEVCHAWEAATEAAANAGIRVVHLRLGIVLSPRGGALAKMLTPFRLGVGGRIGTGRQWMSWIALDDVIGSVYHALATDSLSGPVNAVAPHPVTNQEFAKTLGRLLLRPTIFPLPAFMARLAFGEMADELLLASTRVVPVALQTSGYRFLYGELEGALRHLLGKVEPSSNDAEPRLAHMEHGHRVEAGR